jgi:hypothetical protein
MVVDVLLRIGFVSRQNTSPLVFGLIFPKPLKNFQFTIKKFKAQSANYCHITSVHRPALHRDNAVARPGRRLNVIGGIRSLSDASPTVDPSQTDCLFLEWHNDCRILSLLARRRKEQVLFFLPLSF